MKRLLLYSVICFLSGLLLISCERGVRADREEGPASYQPRPAPVEERAAPPKDVKGELLSVDVKNNLMIVRAENGMEQTFRFNDNTLVLGVEPQRTTVKTTSPPKAIAVRDLIGKEGSEVTVTWNEEAGAKVATSVTVDQLISRKGSLRKGSWRTR
jgi:hypothetical protein